jgi:hypothetical protein
MGVLCVASGCHKSEREGYGFCRAHWALVPKELQKLIRQSRGADRMGYLRKAAKVVAEATEAV